MVVQPRTRGLARGAALRLPPPALIVVASLALAALSLLLPSAPTYDPWAWIIWGREVAHLDLNTINGPSWKPLPVLQTTLTAPFGEASPYLWLVTARAGAFAGVALAWTLAARLAGPVAGFAAAAGLGLMPWWVRNGALGNSEGLMVALVLGAVLAHLDGRRGWAFALALGAGLLRPEAWPFLGLYALWLLVDERGRLPWLAGGLATLPVLWLGPELWGSGNAFRASDRAQLPNRDSPAFADDPALQVLSNAIDMVPAAAVAGAVLAVALVLAQRDADRRTRSSVVGLALLAVLWAGLVAAMTVRGFSGNLRYLVVPGALTIVLGAAGLVLAARALLGARQPVSAAPAALAALALAVVFVAPEGERLQSTWRGLDYQAALYHDLGALLDEAGGPARVRDCGKAFTGPFLVPQVAWRLGVHAEEVGLGPRPPAAVFHVRTVVQAPITPPLDAARPNVLAREGHWALTADCEAGR